MTDSVGRERFSHAVILAGGSSRRMGEDKALLELAGRPLVDRLAVGLASCFARVALSVATRDQGERYLDVLRGSSNAVGLRIDREPGRGPLEGLRVALAALEEGERAFFVAVDVPFVPLAIVEALWAAVDRTSARGAMAVSGRGVEPAFAVYSRSLLTDIDDAIACREMSLRQMADWEGVERLPVVENDGAVGEMFMNVNAPEDLASVRDLIESGRAPRDPIIRERLP